MVKTLKVSEYLTKLRQTPVKQILDIRTSLEFRLGHLDGATSCSVFDWNGNMPIFGLAAATKHVPINGTKETARQRVANPR